ncbi:MAG: hypothetical protein U0441_35095 [Polyangiaceae bacterium]
MNTAPRSKLARSIPSFAAALGVLSAAAIALAQAPSGTAAATGTAAPSGAPDARPPAVTAEEYTWPTEASAEPTDAEFDAAATLKIRDNPYEKASFSAPRVCYARVVREWVRLRCDATSEDTSYGVVWGLAGDTSSLKARMPLRATLEPNKTPGDFFSESKRQMGAYVTLAFQVKPGAAFLADLDEMGWDFGGWGDAFLFVRQAATVEVSWAAGEKAPAILLH